MDALLGLHEEVGPSRTTVSAVAARAGVERLTVYRHFPDEPAMLRACSSHWADLNPAPTIGPLDRADPLGEVRKTLLAVYPWYRSNERLLVNVIADMDRIALLGELMAPLEDYAAQIATRLDRLFSNRNARRATTLRHALEFTTWRSLSRLRSGDRQAADVVLSWIRIHEQD